MEKRLSYYKLLLNTIYDISLELNSKVSESAALQNVMNIMSNNLHIQNGTILIADPDTGLLMPKASHGLSRAALAEMVYKSGEGMVGKVFKYGFPIMLHDISLEPDFKDKIKRKDEEKTSFIAVPISHGNERIGVLAVDKHYREVVSYEAEVDILKMISALVASFMHKMKLINSEKKELIEEKERLRSEVAGKFSVKGLVGGSKLMQDVFKRISQVCRTKTTVLIRGESGTGKEMVAKAIHYSGDRSQKPFVAVNCAAIPKELIESELFGYKKGAFTGANADKKGKFELANGGTIFLDEIGDMPLEAQSKLLRVLQEMSIERIGGSESTPVDVRVIAATNRNLENAVRSGDFRLDLYYRLNVVSIFLPPLRQRREDIPELAKTALEKFNTNYGTKLKISPDVFPLLMKCSWPGNIRELENCIERAALSVTGNEITPAEFTCSRGEVCLAQLLENNGHAGCGEHAVCIESLNMDMSGGEQKFFCEHYPKSGEKAAEEPAKTAKPHTEMPLAVDDERQMVIDALEKTGWVQAKAARLLGMTVRQINYRIMKFGIEVKRI